MIGLSRLGLGKDTLLDDAGGPKVDMAWLRNFFTTLDEKLRARDAGKNGTGVSGFVCEGDAKSPEKTADGDVEMDGGTPAEKKTEGGTVDAAQLQAEGAVGPSPSCKLISQFCQKVLETGVGRTTDASSSSSSSTPPTTNRSKTNKCVTTLTTVADLRWLLVALSHPGWKNKC